MQSAGESRTQRNTGGSESPGMAKCLVGAELGMKDQPAQKLGGDRQRLLVIRLCRPQLTKAALE